MQSPGTAIDSVVSYLRRIDPPNASLAVDRFFCLDAYRNRGEIIPLGPAFYGARTSDADKAKCARGLQEISDTVRVNRNVYVARSSPDEYELRLHDARLVQQYEAMASVAGNTAAGGPRARPIHGRECPVDSRQAPAGSRIVLWAHNGHIGRFTGSMGGQLQANTTPTTCRSDSCLAADH
jgi:erythromycin esterase-like protein